MPLRSALAQRQRTEVQKENDLNAPGLLSLYARVMRQRMCSAKQLTGHPAGKVRHSQFGRLWTIMAVTVPIIVSAIALAVSLLSYRDQHRTDTSAAAATERAAADLASVWDSYGPLSVTVQNLGQAPIYNVTLLTTAYVPPDATPRLRAMARHEKANNPLPLGIIPPCSSSIVTLANLFIQGYEDFSARWPPGMEGVIVTGAEFTDANGINWGRSMTGTLRRIPHSLPFSGSARPSVSLIARIKPAKGCS